ncbi:cache domain-containing protein [Dyadobacter sandarakinus]|uniref:Cache domain-containing protein n=1 Tax=Dyadobacter sandarakinus TaxID=2747268 RepID=A0ABX7I772_9BACT|nr:cache domain-containing protein [Dyadobacter sandarakinus]QRR01402.1 hypothetical protein HWI92_11055 [Dyadobacter sandarakinus]
MKFLNISAERIPIIITLVIVIFLGSGYYFVYIPGNEKDIKEWKFRALTHTGHNIQEKIGTGHKQLKTYLHSKKVKDATTSHTRAFKKSSSIKDLNGFLKKLLTDNLPISNLLPGDSNKVFVSEFLDPSTNPKKITLADTLAVKSGFYELRLTYDFDKFIKPLLSKQVFDQYFVIGEDAVLYEDFASGLDPGQDSLFRTCGKLQGALITDREYAGKLYKLFVLPIDLNADTKILLVGLLTADHFSEAKTRLPPRLILLLITLFTCILVTFPIIKLYQLAEGDRLTISDVISVTIITSLLVSLIFFCFVKYSTVSSEDKRHAKQNLAETISGAFKKEIKENYLKLALLDRWSARYPQFKPNFYDVGKLAKDLSAQKENLNLVMGKTLFDRVFWMDSDGEEIKTWTSESDSSFIPGNFKERPYFKNTRDRRTYAIDGLSNSQLYIDQIVSWVSGKFLTVIAKPALSDKAVAAVFLFNEQSLKKTKIPPGYAFAMIDYNGRVLYHSDSTKPLNENLFDEFSEQRNLQSSIKSGISQHHPFNTMYYGREYEVQMQPVGGGIPFYIVIMEDLMFEEFRDVNVYTFTFSMQFILFGLIIIQVLAIFLSSTRLLKTKGRSFETGWLGPKSNIRKEYFIAMLFNLGMFVILQVFFMNETILTRIFMLLSALAILPAFLSMLYFKRYSRSAATRPLATVKFRSACVAAAFIIPIELSAYILPNQSFAKLIDFQLIALYFGSILYFEVQNLPQSASFRKFFCFKKAYTGMLASWLLVSMGLPIVLFFNAAYNYDQHMIARFMQLEMAESNVGETARMLRVSGDTLNNARISDIKNSFYKDHYWIDSVCVGAAKDRVNDADEAAINLMRSFHLYSSDKIPDRLPIYNSFSFDFSFYFNNLLRQNPGEQGASVTYYNLSNGIDLVIKSAALDFHLPDIRQFGGLIPWLIFLLALVAFCFVLFGLVRKIFSLDMIGENRSPQFDPVTWLANGPDKIFLICFRGGYSSNAMLPSSALIFNVAEIPPIKDLPGSKWWRKTKSAISDTQRPIILDHFDYDFKSVETNNRKLNLLEKLSAGNRKILICSAIHPTHMLADSKVQPQENTDKLKDDIYKYEERWHSLLRLFNIEINPITISGSAGSKTLSDNQVFDGYVAHYHQYSAIWQSLPDEEKFVLFDLAEDGLVNTYDQDAFRMLLRKGLIAERSGRFKVFDQSFRNFILNGLSRSELAAIMEKVNDNTNWNKTRIPLMLVSVAILVFIISSQREASIKLLTTLGALATAIPALINLLSAISGTNKKPAN